MTKPTVGWVLLLLIGVSRAIEEVVQDVIEGEDVTLECRYSPALSSSDSTLYWIRSNRVGHDNVAIADTPFDSAYTVEHKTSLGRYDLKIKNATYDRDNGKFECAMKEAGTGSSLHQSVANLVVLLPPSQPTIEPTTPTATEGRAFNLTCSSLGGSPPPHIYWYKNGESQKLKSLYLKGATKDEATKSVLTIIPKKEDDGSTYRCTVWNRAIPENGLMEASTSINVNYFPRVTVGPENPVRVERDDTAELICKVDAKPPVDDVRWMRDGRFIQQTFKHLIPRANLKDDGPYICAADNHLGQVGKAEVKLDVLFGPEVSVPPLREVGQGEEVVVHCQVSANPRPTTIVWSKEGDSEFRQTGPTLRLPGTNPAATNNGRYTCSATNFIQPTNRARQQRDGNATISIAVRHKPGKTFITPETPIGREGQPITLTCGAKPEGHPAPTYRWWKEGSKSTTLAAGQEFTIDAARLSHAGKYFCQPSNKLGQGTVAETLLQVHQEPKIDSGLQPEIIKRAGDTGFQSTCSAVAKPKPKVKWYKDGTQIDDSTSDLYQVSVIEQPETVPNKAFKIISTLKFVGPKRINGDQLMPTDRGDYTCEFTNEVASKASTMLLRVQHSPVVRHQHNKVAADVGETASISCRMQAYPNVIFDWSKESSMLTDKTQYNMNVTELNDDIYEGVLHIKKVTDSTYGEYSCKAYNSLGTQRTKIKLQEKSKPERPENVRAVQNSPDSIVLEWDEGFNGGYDDTTYNIDYKEIGGGGKKHVDCRRRNPCNITGLEQFTTYQFKVKALNIRGESQWSRDIKVTTEVDVSLIPQPEEIHFATTTNIVEFNIVKYELPLTAKIELENEDGTWRPYRQLGLDGQTYGQMPINDPVSGLRIRLCLTTNEVLCGEYDYAKIVKFTVGNLKQSPLGQPWLVAVLVVVAILSVAVCCLLIKCFCFRNKQPKKLTKEDIAGPRVPTSQQAYNYGQDSKGVDTAKDTAESPDIIKSQMYGYNYPPVPAAQVPTNAGYEHSGSPNSNNGGSVNSQDSLWNVKHPNGETIPANGYAGGYYNDPHQQQMMLQQQQMHHQQQIQMQQQQQQMQMQQQYAYNQQDDYAHYPNPEEYMMNQDRNRAYFANGDQYALPNKSRQHRLDSDYSPYGDVSGLPDPYTGHDISEELRHNPHYLDGASHAGVSLHSNEAEMHPPPEGYSTPSRRVIREIIV